MATSFTIRVELHGASSADYETLHQKMSARGYKRYVVLQQASSGEMKAFVLPTAEYDHTSDRGIGQIRDEVVEIASTVRSNPWVLVTKVADRAIQSRVIEGANAA